MKSGERIEIGVFAGLVILAVLPTLVGRYLPLFDYPAHLAVAAALRHRADPATAVNALWSLDVRLVPNSLHYALTWLLSFVMPLETASRLFVGLFCIAALPLAAAFLLRTFGRDWRLAVLVVPLCWGRGLWYGFIGFCAAVPMSLVVLALLERDLARPAVRREAGLAGLAALLAFAHFFMMMVTVGLGVVLALTHAGRTARSRLVRCVVPLAAGPAIMAPWFLASLRSGPSSGPSSDPSSARGPIVHLFASRPALSDYAALLRHWFIDGYAGRLDDALAVVMVLTLAVMIAYGRRAATDAPVARRQRMAPLVLAAALAIAYLALPFEIRAPFHWWAMNVRLIPLLFVWLIVAVPPGVLDGVGRLVLVPVTVATAAYLVYVGVDVARTFNGPWGTAGLDQVLAEMPKGAHVLGLYTDYPEQPHYAHYPFHYASSYAVVRGGGVAAPFIPIPQSWTNPRQIPDFPLAGDAALFRFPQHVRGFTHFLVRTCAGRRCIQDPLAGRPQLRRIAEQGRWRLYECSSPPCGADVRAPPSH